MPRLIDPGVDQHGLPSRTLWLRRAGRAATSCASGVVRNCSGRRRGAAGRHGGRDRVWFEQMSCPVSGAVREMEGGRESVGEIGRGGDEDHALV